MFPTSSNPARRFAATGLLALVAACGGGGGATDVAPVITETNARQVAKVATQRFSTVISQPLAAQSLVRALPQVGGAPGRYPCVLDDGGTLDVSATGFVYRADGCNASLPEGTQVATLTVRDPVYGTVDGARVLLRAELESSGGRTADRTSAGLESSSARFAWTADPADPSRGKSVGGLILRESDRVDAYEDVVLTGVGLPPAGGAVGPVRLVDGAAWRLVSPSLPGPVSVSMAMAPGGSTVSGTVTAADGSSVSLLVTQSPQPVDTIRGSNALGTGSAVFDQASWSSPTP